MQAYLDRINEQLNNFSIDEAMELLNDLAEYLASQLDDE